MSTKPHTLALVLLTLVTLPVVASANNADFDINGVELYVQLDDSSDICIVSIVDNQIHVDVYQFDPDLFTESWMFFGITEAAAELYAEVVYHRVYELDEFDRIVIEAFDGGDLIRVEDSFDGGVIAYGGPGDDYLRAGSNSSFLHGGSGNDVLIGSPRSDALYGDSGDDELYGGDYHDYLYGGSGRDALFGEGGNDRLEGEFGDDWLYGGSGADALLGGAGNDYLDGGYDGLTDHLQGDIGADEFMFRRFRVVNALSPVSSSPQSRTTWLGNLTVSPTTTSSRTALTTQETVETDTVLDYVAADGDVMRSERVN